jgi:hypothetical protein
VEAHPGRGPMSQWIEKPDARRGEFPDNRVTPARLRFPMSLRHRQRHVYPNGSATAQIATRSTTCLSRSLLRSPSLQLKSRTSVAPGVGQRCSPMAVRCGVRASRADRGDQWFRTVCTGLTRQSRSLGGREESDSAVAVDREEMPRPFLYQHLCYNSGTGRGP